MFEKSRNLSKKSSILKRKIKYLRLTKGKYQFGQQTRLDLSHEIASTEE